MTESRGRAVPAHATARGIRRTSSAFDGTLNYETAVDFNDELEQFCPHGIDAYSTAWLGS